jgi:hypothetical protein
LVECQTQYGRLLIAVVVVVAALHLLKRNLQFHFVACPHHLAFAVMKHVREIFPMLLQTMNSIFLYSSLQFVIGNGNNMSDFTYVENVVHANICAEQALSLNATSVDGKVYF